MEETAGSAPGKEAAAVRARRFRLRLEGNAPALKSALTTCSWLFRTAWTSAVAPFSSVADTARPKRKSKTVKSHKQKGRVSDTSFAEQGAERTRTFDLNVNDGSLFEDELNLSNVTLGGGNPERQNHWCNAPQTLYTILYCPRTDVTDYTGDTTSS